jgi:hypothetical protein
MLVNVLLDIRGKLILAGLLTILVKVLLEIRGRLILTGGLRCLLTYY